MKQQVVKTDKGYVAISDEQPSQKDTRTEDQGKWTLSLFDSWIGQLSMEYRGLWRIEWKVNDSVGNLLSDPHPPENYRMIVATDTTFKLEGIPQFELEKSPLREELRDIIAGDWCKHEDDEPYIEQTADACYKAAQSKGCFTEEDMRNAYDAGKQRQFWEEDYKDGSKILEQNAPNFETFIQFLKQPKKLVAIEINDMEASQWISNEKEHGRVNINLPIVTKSEQHPDGLLTIKQYFYE